ncbi:PP2C family protein-serine/threonine phosphatase [Klenkia terrae]|uniref:GAF domain-containing SpoIIE family protein phosphatase n=1 Tax=Klenkia terrae TaxID=1052259 RepID=A0ABU8E7E5_9ACTN|nr:GAF domain-containing SpoIIE family protein phosphatase [Klenkia terrae]SSC23491.1 PPM-type phosphatase with GAF domain [Klenkia terrae]
MTDTVLGGLPAQLPVVAVPAPDPAFERFARLVRQLLGVPVALVSFVDVDEQVLPGALGLPEPWASTRRTPLTHSFCQHVVRSGAPLLVEDARITPLVWENSAIADLGVIAYAGMPLLDALGQVVGSLCAIDHRPRRWTPQELTALEDLAVACSSELQLRTLRVQSSDAATRAAASLADRRVVAETLQAAMLTHLPEVDGLEFRARYAASHAGDQVGGDWYDAFGTAQGGTVAAIGDVTGHDMQAAATMGQLRTLLRAFAYDRGERPSQTLRRLDRAVAGLDVAGLATVVLARIEQAGAEGARTLHWSNAGHPAPVLLHPDGSTTLLERRPDLLVGVDGERARRDWTTELQPGDTLLLYTDGLIEHRHLGADVDRGIAALRRTLTEHHRLPLDALLDVVLAENQHGHDDDIALLAVRVAPEGYVPPPRSS